MSRSDREVRKPIKLKSHVTDSDDEVMLTYQVAVQGEERVQ